MDEINRDDIYIINRNSNLDEEKVAQLLRKNIYSSTKAWKQFLRILFLSLGLSFLLSGIIFFFAYNWADMPKFLKLGLVESLLVIATIPVFIPKIRPVARNILLSGASVLVGVLFAVFGQIYQTGANAYDFFFGWTLSITLWVLVSNFAPLWLMYILLVNVTLHLYIQQVAGYWNDFVEINLLFALNLIFLAAAFLLPKRRIIAEVPSWFTNILAIGTVVISTAGISFGIHSPEAEGMSILVPLAAVSYTAGVFHGYYTKNEFYLAIIPFSLVIIISSLLMKISTDVNMFLITCIFIIASVTMIIKTLLDIRRKWKH